MYFLPLLKYLNSVLTLKGKIFLKMDASCSLHILCSFTFLLLHGFVLIDSLFKNGASPTGPCCLLICTMVSVFGMLSPSLFKCIPQIQRYLKHYDAWRKKNVVIRPFVTVHRNIRFPPDRKDIMGFSLATVHAISKTMVHEVEQTAKNRSGGKMSPMTIGCDPRDFPFYSETLHNNISYFSLSLYSSFFYSSLISSPPPFSAFILSFFLSFLLPPSLSLYLSSLPSFL